LVLKKSAIAYYNAFQNIARNTRTIFIHAYQSYVWNRTVSERIRRHGDKVLVGDFVIEPEAAKIVEEAANPDDLLIEQADVEEIDLPEELDSTTAEGKKPKDHSGEKKIEDALIEVTEENIQKYTLKDVVLPICGFRTRMTPNKELTDIMLKIMAEDKITMETYEKQALLDSTSAWGSYRKIIGFAQDIEYDIVEYQNINEDLLNPNYNVETDPKPAIDRTNEDEKPVYKALRLKFSLKQSSYATMLLREVTRMSSAYNVQSAMSNQINQA
jgi:tRNA pseudouridine13 synthase